MQRGYHLLKINFICTTVNPHAMSFTLRNINIDEFLKDDDFKTTKETKDKKSDANKNKIVFHDGNNRLKTCDITFINTNKQTDSCKYKCFWCRDDIKTQPVGIPINYKFNKLIKSYVSQLNNETYCIHENTLNECVNENGIQIEKNKIYVINGVCCSWNCAMAYIYDNDHLPEYKSSKMLLHQMYGDVHKDKKDYIIKPSPHWKLLSCHGGHMSYDTFNKKIENHRYTHQGTMQVKTQYMGELFEEKIHI